MFLNLVNSNSTHCYMLYAFSCKIHDLFLFQYVSIINNIQSIHEYDVMYAKSLLW